MLSQLLRILPFGIGFMSLILAWFSWVSGSPPTRSIFTQRVPVEVVSSRVQRISVGDGQLRYVPFVEVRWIGGSGVDRTLRGLVSGFSARTKRTAENAIRPYPSGAKVLVRPVDGVLYANRTETLGLVQAVFLSVIAVIFLVPGLLLMLPGSGQLWRLRGFGPKRLERNK